MDQLELDRMQGYLLDMDGTFYLGDRLLPGAKEFLEFLEQREIPFLFLTNNSSRHRGHYAQKLARLGLDVPEEKIFTSGEATCLWLQNNYPDAKVYLMGTPALQDEFQAHGIPLAENEPTLVVLGFDTTLTYEKLWKLCDWVRMGLPYIATHHDFVCPTPQGPMPDVGAMIAFVEAAVGRRPDVIIGKPHLPMVEALQEKIGMPRDALCMIGDRLYTDIAMGAHGIRTILVLSGETQAGDLAQSDVQPDVVFENLQAVLQYLQGTSRA